MSSSAPTADPTADPESGSRIFLPPIWLISKPVDLLVLFGGVFVSFAFFFAWQSGVLTADMLVLLWIFVFHGPHFWGQISRTFLDRSELASRGPVLRRSLLWFVVGPVFIGVGLVLESVTRRADFWQLFFFLAALWAYHHVIKQHFGFMALYRAKHREFDKGELMMHKRYLIVSLWVPIVILFCTVALPTVPFVMWLSEGIGVGPLLSFSSAVAQWGPWVFLAIQVAFSAHLLRRVVTGRGINLPETLIIVASVSLHWFVVSAFFDTTANIAVTAGVLTALLTIYHNLQYHALLWFYNRAKYRVENARERYGAAAFANGNMFVYFALGVLYTVVTIGFQYYDIELLKHVDSDPTIARVAALGLAAAIWGFSFVHYWLDSKIWHVREDEELRRVLGFAPPPATAATAPAGDARA